jgi:stage II sporulation protein D
MRFLTIIALLSTLTPAVSLLAAEQVVAPEILEQIREPTAPRNIQILLEQSATEALLEVKGPYFLFNPHDGTKIASGLLGKRFMVHALESGLKWGEEFPGLYQFYLQPRSEETTIFINGIQYSGSVAVFAVGNRINIVNELDIESYVKGILSVQASSTMESEVMAALAILARTNAYYAVSRHRDAFWHVSAQDSHFQGTALVSPNSVIEKAVEATRHLILVNSVEGRSLPFASVWTEHSAGKTASYETIFRKEGLAPLKGVEAPHAAIDRKEAKWNYSIPKKTLAHLLEVREIKSVELFIDQASQKVYGLRVQDGQDFHDFDFFELQTRLGAHRLQSSDFTVSLKEDGVSFSGFGKGHGVGLCLFSASAMAHNGENAVKMLSKFFPDTFLLNLNALPQKKMR